MLFSEVYSRYYNAVAEVLARAVSGALTDKEMYDIVREKAFSESVMTIPDLLKKQVWQLMLPDNTTPIRNIPEMPLTELEKRWLKSLLADPRIKLFSPSEQGLETVKPLFSADDFVYYDRYTDSDPYDDPKYIENFSAVLTAVKEKRRLKIRFAGHLGTEQSWECIPQKIEYSAKDDKFRLIVTAPHGMSTINMARVKSCETGEKYSPDEYSPKETMKKELVMDLVDERNALERVMLHFSDLEKETRRIDDTHYRINLKYYTEDEAEILIRVLSFGPVLRVISPDSFITRIKSRIQKQERLRA